MSRPSVLLLLTAGLLVAAGRPARGGQPPAVPCEPEKGPAPSEPMRQLGKARFENGSQVFAVAFSPDGKTVAAAAWDCSVRLWDLATGKEFSQLAGHKGWIRSLAFSPDGKTLAAGGKDRDVYLWDTATDKLRRLTGHQNQVNAVAFSPDGKALATKSADGTLRLWDVADGRELRRLGDKDNEPACPPAFSPDGKTLASGLRSDARRRAIALWDWTDGKQVRRLDVPFDYWMQTLAFAPDGKTLAAAVAGVRLWDVATGKELPPIQQNDPDDYLAHANALAFSPDGRSLAVAGPDRQSDACIRVWELATNQERRRFHVPDVGVVNFAFSPDSRILASGGPDITVFLWDLTGRAEDGRLRPVRLSAEAIQGLWSDLAADAPKAHRAVWQLVAGAADAVPYLGKQLPPVPAPDSKRIAALIADLENEQFAVRQKAVQELEKIESAREALEKALAGKPSLELRQRAEQVLKTLTDWTPERLRVRRAVEALEQIGSPEARQVLRGLAEGAAGALVTGEAKGSLGRLERREAARPPSAPR